ncbi:MAG: hypothetical protein IJE08_06980 [Clostridia bacterium]|nr:hypothetical protein [Clostridia bacterium]
MKRILVFILIMMLMAAPAATADEAAQPMSCNWYEIFVRSYQDGDGDGLGDLKGLMERLDYIDDMGYDGIWLMPIMPSPSYHKYDVTDYMAIDPQYGSVEEFKALVGACHERGIRIIIDLPVNHSSVQHPWFTEACNALRSGDTDNKYIDYYCFTEKAGQNRIPVSGTAWYYEEQFAGGGMPDLNLDSEAVRAEIEEILDFWLTGCGVDGFRLDAVTSYYTSDTERNVEFLKWLNDTAETIKPGCFIVGEAWVGLTSIAEYYPSGIDCFFLFPASQAEGYIARTIRARSKPAQQYVSFFEQVEEAMGDYMIAPFLGNHDTGRAVGSLQARSVPERAKFAEALINLMGGATFTYYGEEIGMVGSGDDPNKRLAMYWNDGDMTQQPPGTTKIEYAFPCADEQMKDGGSLLNYCRALNHLKLSVPSIAWGENEFVYTDGDLCVMKRTWNGEESYIAVNFSSKATHTYELEAEGLTLAGQLDAFEEKAEAEVGATGAELTLPPYAVVVLTK